MVDDDVEALSIGSIVGGSTPANKPWRDAIKALSLHVIAAREGIVSPLNVNVVFQVPGNILSPDFEGVRTGRFDRATSLLLVQVALPSEIPTDVDRYLQDCVRQSMIEAENWATKRRKTGPNPELIEFTNRL